MPPRSHGWFNGPGNWFLHLNEWIENPGFVIDFGPSKNVLIHCLCSVKTNNSNHEWQSNYTNGIQGSFGLCRHKAAVEVHEDNWRPQMWGSHELCWTRRSIMPCHTVLRSVLSLSRRCGEKSMPYTWRVPSQSTRRPNESERQMQSKQRSDSYIGESIESNCTFS